MLVLYCMTNYHHKPHDLKHTYLLSCTSELRSLGTAHLSLLLVSLDWNQCVGGGWILTWSSQSFSRLTEVVGKILFLVVVELRSSFNCWVQAKDYCHFFDASPRAYPVALSKHGSLFLQNQKENPTSLCFVGSYML